MKLIVLLAVVATTTMAQDRSVAVPGAEYLLRVRAADTTKQAEMRITMSGRVLGSLGATKTANGSVSLSGNGGTGTGTVVGSLMASRGRITFSSGLLGDALELVVTPVSGAATLRLLAIGKTVSVEYPDGGPIRVESRP